MSSDARILFILKHRDSGYHGTWNYSMSGKPLPSGLLVSATQITHLLDEIGVPNKLVNVIDNNCIDREVSEYQPTHVVIEAFWVVPEKFDVLKKLHPGVTWIIRNHSKTDFLSHEGSMIGWAIDYVSRGVILACNSPEATRDFKTLAKAAGLDSNLVIYLPNFYKIEHPKESISRVKFKKFIRMMGFWNRNPNTKVPGELNIGCFGAIRPLKNHVHQAIAAIGVANKLNMKLKFWINGTRVEGKADAILVSLRALFKRFPDHELVELPWFSHDEFKEVMAGIDLVSQVSNSETFNIVAADAVSSGVPVIVSNEIPWLDREHAADPNKVEDIMFGQHKALSSSYIVADQQYELLEYSKAAKRVWQQFLGMT